MQEESITFVLVNFERDVFKKISKLKAEYNNLYFRGNELLKEMLKEFMVDHPEVTKLIVFGANRSFAEVEGCIVSEKLKKCLEATNDAIRFFYSMGISCSRTLEVTHNNINEILQIMDNES